MKLNEIHIRDPFILLDNNTYYMYGTRMSTTPGNLGSAEIIGVDVYISEDLKNWSEPIEAFQRPADFWADRECWAPEVHKYKDGFYMFVSLRSESRLRGTQILKADSPTGPFLPHSDGPITPEAWRCLDGTLYVENGNPYMVFCHEWTQVRNGEMCAIKLTEDLKAPAGEPMLLFKAAEPSWVSALGEDGYVTDGPFLYKTAEGRLIMIWSSFTDGGQYCEALTYSSDNTLQGRWVHDDRLLFTKDSGHGMIFRDKQGKLCFVCHQPNHGPLERPVIIAIKEENNSLYAIG